MRGRSNELERVASLLADAASSHGGSLLIAGEAGIGKTTLLMAARARAEELGLRTIAIAGVESEVELPFAGLGELVRPFEGAIGELKGRRARAVSAAIALAEPPPSSGADGLAIYSGCLELVALAARERPLLLLVDDLQWLDASSRTCLGYMARRLDSLPVALVAATREGAGEPAMRDWDAPSITLEGLEQGAARELLEDVAPDVQGRAADAVLDAARGNPLAVEELPALLSPEQRAGSAPLEELPPPAGALADALGGRVARLSEGAAAAILVLAAGADEPPATVVAACAELDIAPAALEEAEREGVVEIGERRISFSHPLLRGAVLERATPAERRRAHAALARASEGDARAWHLAGAAVGADEAAAEELERAGRGATARGAHPTAADALERAAELTVDSTMRKGRQLTAGLFAAMGGDYPRAVSLLEEAAEASEPFVQRGARHLLAMVCLTGGVREAIANHAELSAEAEAAEADDPATAASMHADAGVIAIVAGDCRLALGSAERAVASLDGSTPATTRCQALSIHGMGLALTGHQAQAREALDEAGSLLFEVDPASAAAQSISFALGARLSVGQEALLLEEVSSLERAARETHSIGLLPYFELQAADSALRLGDWQRALAEAREAVATAEASGQLGPLSIALVVLGRALGLTGETAEAREAVERGIEIAEPRGYGSTVIWGRAALGAISLAAGEPERAARELEPLAELTERSGLVDPTIVPWQADLVEALARTQRAGDARLNAQSLADRAQSSGVPAALAMAARCEALVDEVHERAVERLERALELGDEAGLPLERARTLLTLGARQHRAGERRAARARLREARDAFEELGAVPWAEQAAGELAAAGGVERAPRDDDSSLTPRELEVAAAVARGATNREVAAELFLSPKTIEFHLARIYGKLGVRSRTELAAAAAEGLVPGPRGNGSRAARSR